MAFGLDEGIGLAGAVGSYLTGRSAANSQKELSRRQAQIIQQQGKTYAQTNPYYLQLLQSAAQNIGLGQGGQQMGSNGQPMAVRDPVTGHYHDPTPQQDYGGLTPEDNLRLRAAEEDINRNANLGANRLRFQGQLSGLNTGAQEAGQAHNQQLALQQYANYRRQLAIQAPQEQAQRLQQFAGLLNPGLGQGAAASAGYGQQAGQYGQQAAQGFAGVGQALQNYQYQQNLKKYSQQGVPSADSIRNMVGYTG